MRISHKVDYALRAMVALARSEQVEPGRPIRRELLAEREEIPGKFLDDILRTLRNNELVRSHRGPEGGWTLARPARQITVGDIIRGIEGPLASVRGIRPHDLPDEGVDETMVDLWVAVRHSLRSVLDKVTVADLAKGRLPAAVARRAADPAAWTALP